ncbi:4-hydroxy-tetrahydrodipicolinate synthase [Fusibacter bizertensis]
MSIFKGSGVALITPFSEDTINIEVLRQLIDWHIENGTDAIIVSGTTGEASTMTLNEKKILFTETVKQVNKRVPVIAGTGTNSTKTSIENSILAQECGVDGLLVVTPYYNKCTQEGLYLHFEAIASAVILPLILYNVPSRTSVNMLPQTVAKLSKIDNIVGIKEASGDIVQITELFRIIGSDFDVYSGNDDHILPIMALGGVGVITTVGNITPNLMHQLTTHCLNNNLTDARALQFKINPLVQSVFAEVNPIPIKAAVQKLGFEVGSVRLPLTPATDSTIARIEREMLALEVSR